MMVLDEDVLFGALKDECHRQLGSHRKVYDQKAANWLVPPWPLGSLLADVPPRFLRLS